MCSEWLDDFESEEPFEVFKLLLVQLLVQQPLQSSLAFLLLQSCDSQVKLRVFSDNFVSQALELLEDEQVALLVHLRLDLVQILKEGLLSVDHRVFGGLCHDLPLQLLDVFREIGAKPLNIVDLRDQAQLHLVDGVVYGLELLLTNATVLLSARGRARSQLRRI